MNCIRFILLLQILPINICAQSKPKEINVHQQAWFSVNSITGLNKKIGIITDIHVRRNNFLADPSFYFIRTGINYHISEYLSAALGYGHLWQAPSRADWHHYAGENRIYQQVQLNSKFGKNSMVQRIRNEQRWQQKIVNDTFTHHYSFTNRVRYTLAVSRQIFKNPNYPVLFLSDEINLQFGKEIVYNTFDQNRVFIGIKQKISKTANFDFGYMQVFQQKSTGYQFDKNNTLRCFFYVTPALQKKKIERQCRQFHNSIY
jgi:Protein of unknown function (DUF2490)